MFDEFANQQTIFQHSAYPLAEDLLKGKNGRLQSFPDRHGGMLIEFSAIMFDVLHMGAYVGILL